MKYKKIIQLIFMIVLLSLITGCARMKVGLDIKKDGTADVQMLYAVMNSMQDEESVDISKEMTDMEEEGWKCELYDKGGYTGYIAKRKGINLNQIASSFKNDELDFNSDDFTITKNGLYYKINWDLRDTMSEITPYKSYFEETGGYCEFVINLPYRAKSSNATKSSSDGKTLTWDMLECDSIQVEFSTVNVPLIITLVISIILVNVIVVIVIIIVVSKKRAVNNFDYQEFKRQYPEYDQNPYQYNDPSHNYNQRTGTQYEQQQYHNQYNYNDQNHMRK